MLFKLDKAKLNEVIDKIVGAYEGNLQPSPKALGEFIVLKQNTVTVERLISM